MGSLVTINFDKIGEAAKTLIERACDYYWEPERKVREAKAEKVANIIKAEGEIEVNTLLRRTQRRVISEETKKQENLEKITIKALKDLNDNSNPRNIDEDWLAKFKENAKLVSDQVMQTLWAKILAGEANKTRSFSKRTLEMVSLLEKQEARDFTNLCTFCWKEKHRTEPIPLIFDHLYDCYGQKGIHFETLHHLDQIGLLKFETLRYQAKYEKRKVIFQYYGRDVLIEFDKDKKVDLDLGFVMLSKCGIELVPICGSDPSDSFFDFVFNYWKNQGHKVTKLDPGHNVTTEP